MFDPASNIAEQLMKAVEHHRRNLPAAQKARDDRAALEQMVVEFEALSSRRGDPGQIES